MNSVRASLMMWVIVSLLLVVALVAPGGVGLAQAPQGATMTVLRGQVAVIRPDGSAIQPAPSGSSVFPGDEIRTLTASGAIITFFAGTEIEMGQDTVLVVDRVSRQGDQIDVSLKQVFGTAVHRVQTLTGSNSTYEVNVGGVVALARGSVAVAANRFPYVVFICVEKVWLVAGNTCNPGDMYIFELDKSGAIISVDRRTVNVNQPLGQLQQLAEEVLDDEFDDADDSTELPPDDGDDDEDDEDNGDNGDNTVTAATTTTTTGDGDDEDNGDNSVTETTTTTTTTDVGCTTTTTVRRTITATGEVTATVTDTVITTTTSTTTTTTTTTTTSTTSIVFFGVPSPGQFAAVLAGSPSVCTTTRTSTTGTFTTAETTTVLTTSTTTSVTTSTSTSTETTTSTTTPVDFCTICDAQINRAPTPGWVVLLTRLFSGLDLLSVTSSILVLGMIGWTFHGYRPRRRD